MRKYLKGLLGLNKQQVIHSMEDMREQQEEAVRLSEQEEAKNLLAQTEAQRRLAQEEEENLQQQKVMMMRIRLGLAGLDNGGFKNRNLQQELPDSLAFIPQVEKESISSLVEKNTTKTSMAR